MGKEFDEDQYGGLQEIISFSTVRAMIKEALSKGLYDVTLDRTWEVPGFQLFMGDLGNAVPYATYAPAGDRFNVSCNYDKTRADELKIARYDEHDIYVSVPENCQISYNNTPVLGIKMGISIVVRLVNLALLRWEERNLLRLWCNPLASLAHPSPVWTPTTRLKAFTLHNTPSLKSSTVWLAKVCSEVISQRYTDATQLSASWTTGLSSTILQNNESDPFVVIGHPLSMHIFHRLA